MSVALTPLDGEIVVANEELLEHENAAMNHFYAAEQNAAMAYWHMCQIWEKELWRGQYESFDEYLLHFRHEYSARGGRVCFGNATIQHVIRDWRTYVKNGNMDAMLILGLPRSVSDRIRQLAVPYQGWGMHDQGQMMIEWANPHIRPRLERWLQVEGENLDDDELVRRFITALSDMNPGDAHREMIERIFRDEDQYDVFKFSDLVKEGDRIRLYYSWERYIEDKLYKAGDGELDATTPEPVLQELAKRIGVGYYERA